MADKDIVPAEKTGRWVAGKSGNPKGRPLTRRDRILDSKQKLEEILRGNVDHKRIGKVLEKLVSAAEKGDLRAAKTLLPYFLTKASDGAEDGGGGDRGGIVFRIENATLIKPQRQVIAIDAEVISDG